MSILLAAILYTNCLQCVNGKLIVNCPDCNGRGFTIQNYTKKFPCRRCPSRLYSPRHKSSGKIKVKCFYCNGKRKINVESIDIQKEK